MTRGQGDVERTPELITSLGARWTVTAGGYARTLVQILGQRLQASARAQPDADGDTLRFRLDLSGIYLCGLGEDARCLLAGGDGTGGDEPLRRFWHQEGSSGLPLVFCVSPAAHAASQRVLPRGAAVCLAPENLDQLIQTDTPRPFLKQIIRRQVSRRRLSVYSICLPATGNSFFGRTRELNQLLDNHAVNYAIAGPGRIGKTSLLKRHRWNLTCRRDPRASRTFEIDFYSLTDVQPDTVTRHIAMAIDSSSRSSRMQPSDLLAFLRSQKNELGGSLELLLDETDAVCDTEAFRQLGHAAKQGYVRLVMGGRGRLYEYGMGPGSSLGGRLNLMRLEPLEPAEATELIRQPLGDLGLAIREPGRLIDYLLRQSGRLPHLIQLYCQQFIEQAVERGLDEVTLDMVKAVESRGEVARYFLEPLEELEDATTLRLALAFLSSPQERFTAPDTIGIARGVGSASDPLTVRRVCDRLVIQNVLAWERGDYVLACQALRHFARQAGLLSAIAPVPFSARAAPGVDHQ